MKLQEASKKEVLRMAKGCAVCTLPALAGFFLLYEFDILKTFDYKIVIGIFGGTLVAIGNFTLLCLMVQSAAATDDSKLRKAKVQMSYNLRLILQAGWVVAAFLIPWINVLAAAVPLLFPTIVIYYLRSTGKLMPPSESAPKQGSSEPEELPDHPGPFET